MDIEIEVEKAKKGNKEAFTNLIKHYEQYLYRISVTILKSDSDCRDALQETIIKAYENIEKLRNTNYFKTWITKILINESNKILRGRKKIVSLEEGVLGGNNANEHRNVEINEAIDFLEADLKTVVLLYYFEDLPINEISSILDIPSGTVKSRLSRARSKLKLFLQIDSEKEGLV